MHLPILKSLHKTLLELNLEILLTRLTLLPVASLSLSLFLSLSLSLSLSLTHSHTYTRKHRASGRLYTRAVFGSAVFQYLNHIPKNDRKEASPIWVERLRKCAAVAKRENTLKRLSKKKKN